MSFIGSFWKGLGRVWTSKVVGLPVQAENPALWLTFAPTNSPLATRNPQPVLKMPDQPSWADTAASLLSKLSGGVELSLNFDQMELQMPNAQGQGSTYRLNGALRIRTKGEAPAAAAATPQLPPANRPEPLG